MIDILVFVLLICFVTVVFILLGVFKSKKESPGIETNEKQYGSGAELYSSSTVIFYRDEFEDYYEVQLEIELKNNSPVSVIIEKLMLLAYYDGNSVPVCADSFAPYTDIIKPGESLPGSYELQSLFDMPEEMKKNLRGGKVKRVLEIYLREASAYLAPKQHTETIEFKCEKYDILSQESSSAGEFIPQDGSYAAVASETKVLNFQERNDEDGCEIIVAVETSNMSKKNIVLSKITLELCDNDKVIAELSDSPENTLIKDGGRVMSMPLFVAGMPVKTSGGSISRVLKIYCADSPDTGANKILTEEISVDYSNGKFYCRHLSKNSGTVNEKKS